jgi:hypothetical protein
MIDPEGAVKRLVARAEMTNESVRIYVFMMMKLRKARVFTVSYGVKQCFRFLQA